MKIVREITAADGTRKFLIELDDGNFVESVLIQHKRTLCACVSSQVGCAMNCSFCATGAQGFTRNLTAEEIVGQLELMSAKITNVVFMGMGEPLNNYDAVVDAVKKIHSKGLSWQKITVSTVGIPDKIVQLGRDCKCRLALSLHAPDDELRSKLVPANKTYTIKSILDACRQFPANKKNPVMIEYVLLKGVNDSEQHAAKLTQLLKQLPFVMINLIPFNPTNNFQRPDEKTILQFKKILVDAGFKTIIRTQKGVDVNAACGMLNTNKLYKPTV